MRADAAVARQGLRAAGGAQRITLPGLRADRHAAYSGRYSEPAGRRAARFKMSMPDRRASRALEGVEKVLTGIDTGQ
jgi:hypothetical protein